MAKLPEGIYLVDKPGGITSHDVVNILKKRFPRQKVGHAGTLDPLATGLLIIGVGNATKLLGQYIKLSKIYIAKIALYIETDTGDVDGKVIRKNDVPIISKEQIKIALDQIVGEH